MKICFEETAV